MQPQPFPTQLARLALASVLALAPMSVNASLAADPFDPHTTVTSDGRTFNVAMLTPAEAVRQDTAAWTLPYAGPNANALAPDRIIGSDDRVRVTNTQVFPYSAVVYVVTASGTCSGFMLSPNKVVTAAHCLYRNGGWITVNYVVPGKNGSTEPYGRCGVTDRLVTAGWTVSGSPDYDYGAVKLNCTIGYSTGWWGLYTNANDWYFLGRGEALTQYPGDKPLGTMWQSEGTITSVTARQLFYTNDAFSGASGGPLWSFHAPAFLVEAINANEYDAPSNNSGIRITQEVFNNLVNW